MATAPEMKVLITGDASSAMSELDKFAAKVQSSIENVSGGFARMALGFGSVAGAVEMLSQKGIEGLKKLADFIPESIKQVNDIARSFEGLKLQLGESLENLNVYDATMKMTGGSMDELTGWLTGVTRSLRSNSEVFIANGVAANQAALMRMKPIDIMRGALSVIEGETDQTKKLVLAQEMLGRASIAELPQMHRFFDTLEEGRKAFEKLGKSIDTEAIQRMQAMEKEIGRLHIAQDEFTRSLAENASPIMLFWEKVKTGTMAATSETLKYWQVLAANPLIGSNIAGIQAARRLIGVYSNQEEAQANVGAHDADRSRAGGTHTKEEIEAAAKDQREAAAEADRQQRKEDEENRRDALAAEAIYQEQRKKVSEVSNSEVAAIQRKWNEEDKKNNEEYFKWQDERLKLATKANEEAAKAQEAAWVNPVWVSLAENTIDHLANDTARAITEMQRNHQSFANVLKGIWTGVESSIIGSLVKMEAEQLKAATLDQTVAAMKAAAMQTSTAAVMSHVAAVSGADAVEETASEKTAAANFFSWFSFLGPFGIPAAIAAIAVMTATISKIVAHATGGLIDRPTLALMGEAGPEVVAPASDFQDWSRANQNLGYNLASHDAQVGRLGGLAGSYASAGLAQNGGRMPKSQILDARGSMFLDSTSAKRVFDGLLNDSDVRRGRAQG